MNNTRTFAGLHRFFVRPEAVSEGRVRIEGQDARQICSVLRLRDGDRIAAVDGSGNAFIVKIVDAASSLILGDVVQVCPMDTEPKVRLTIAQSLPKGDKLEFVIQKGTELGVAKFDIVTTARTISRPGGDRVEKRLGRWRAIAKEAAEQSCRAVVPEVNGVSPIDELLGQVDRFDLAICLWEGEGQASLREILSANRSAMDVLLIIGPEGGLEEEEVRRIEARGARTASLGRRILRCETAAIAAAAIVLHELGD